MDVQWTVHPAGAWTPVDGPPRRGEYTIHDARIAMKYFSVDVDDAGNVAYVNAFVLPFER